MTTYSCLTQEEISLKVACSLPAGNYQNILHPSNQRLSLPLSGGSKLQFIALPTPNNVLAVLVTLSWVSFSLCLCQNPVSGIILNIANIIVSNLNM